MPDQRRARYAFKFGEVFPETDMMARYVMRLSIGLNDLRTVGRHVIRQRQTHADRAYFIRLMASHLHEIALVLEPKDTTVVPDVEVFLSALPRGNKPPRALIRKAHARTIRALDRPMSNSRPLITVDGRQITPRLRDDLKRLRNGFLHYADHKRSDRDLSAAMAIPHAIRTGRTSNTNLLRSRAEYAYDVALNLMHPFTDDALDVMDPFNVALIREMHNRIVEALGPVSSYIGLVEEAWLYKQPPGVVTYTLPGRKAQPLRR